LYIRGFINETFPIEGGSFNFELKSRKTSIRVCHHESIKESILE